MDSTSTTPTKSLDSGNDTPPHVQIQSTNSCSFTNGNPKNYEQELHQQQPPSTPHLPLGFTYKQCLKNHAASIGLHAVDGCGEFMPSSTANSTDPSSLKCAACGCHRNFHLRVPDEIYSSPTPISSNRPTFHDFQRNTLSQSRMFSPSPSPPPSLQPPLSLALSTPEKDNLPSPVTPTAGKRENLGARKRSRTKFTEDQKATMLRYAETMDWRMPRPDEFKGVQELCNQIGVSRGVLKVWMHNNKHKTSKKDGNSNDSDNNNGNENAGILGFQSNGNSDLDKNGGVHQNHISGIGSSPSSS